MRKMFLLLGSMLAVCAAYATPAAHDNIPKDVDGNNLPYSFVASAGIAEYIDIAVAGAGWGWTNDQMAATVKTPQLSADVVTFTAQSNVPLNWAVYDGSVALSSSTTSWTMPIQYQEVATGNLLAAAVGDAAIHTPKTHTMAPVLKGDGMLAIYCTLTRQGTQDEPGSYDNAVQYKVSITK